MFHCVSLYLQFVTNPLLNYINIINEILLLLLLLGLLLVFILYNRPIYEAHPMSKHGSHGSSVMSFADC